VVDWYIAGKLPAPSKTENKTARDYHHLRIQGKYQSICGNEMITPSNHSRDRFPDGRAESDRIGYNAPVAIVRTG
jgi:hypothetical protein